MTTTYLLACSCGEKLPVAAPQAGQTVTCPCGQVLEVPTIRRLAKLQRVEETTPAETPSRWGPREGLILLGAVITSAALIATCVLHVKKHLVAKEAALLDAKFTDEFTEEMADKIRRDIQQMSPAQTWRVWASLRYNIRRLKTPREIRREQMRLEKKMEMSKHDPWLIVTYVMIALGMVVVVVPMLSMSPVSKQPRQP